jgi:hypothetical protein
VTTTQARCPDCSSLVRPGMAWCTLCHADLRSDEEKAAAAAEASLVLAHSGGAESAEQADAADGTDAPQVTQAPVASRGRHARPAPEAEAMPAVLAKLPAKLPADRIELDADAAAVATAAETDAKLAELQAAGIDVDSMLAMLAIDKPRDPVTTFVEQRLSTKGSRAIAIIVASTTLTALCILVMFALGTFFG